MLNPGARYVLKLKSAPNPDFDELVAPKPPMEAVGDLAEVLSDAMEYRTGLGAGNWARADLYVGGKKVGRVSYNGRVWPPGPWKPGMAPID